MSDGEEDDPAERLRLLEAEVAELRKESARAVKAADPVRSPATQSRKRVKRSLSRRKRITRTDFVIRLGPGAETEDGFQGAWADLLHDQAKIFKESLCGLYIRHVNSDGEAISLGKIEHQDDIFSAILEQASKLGKGTRPPSLPALSQSVHPFAAHL